MEEKKIKKATNSFTPRPSCDGQKDFQTEYIDRVPKQVVRKTGEGEDDYVLVDKIVEQRQNIDALIQAQVGEVGVYNLLDRVAKTGDDTLLPKPHDDSKGAIVDYTGYPSDLLEAQKMADAGANAFLSLPDDLKKGRSLEEFAKGITDEEAQAFIKSFIQARFGKKEKVEGEKDENK